MQRWPDSLLVRCRLQRDPTDKVHEPRHLEQIVVGVVRKPFGEQCRVGGNDTSLEVGIEIADLLGEHGAAVIEAFIRPPEHHTGPFDDDREHE